MVQKVLIGLLCLTVVVLAVLVAYLFTGGAGEDPGKQDEKREQARKEVVAKEGESAQKSSNPTSPPKKVDNPDRIRQSLVKGKTYFTHIKGTFYARGTDAAWSVEGVVTINYAFEAFVDREIVENDGVTVVELRHFRDVRQIKALCDLEDVRLDLGPIGKTLIPPEWRVFAENASLKPLLNTLPWLDEETKKLLGTDKANAAFSTMGKLAGKSVRITYRDGKGVEKVEAVKGEMTAAERDFHMSSVLVSDSLIFPNQDIKDGISWDVDGSNFSNFIDPSLLARTSGRLEMKRQGRKIVKFEFERDGRKFSRDEECILIKAHDGRLTLDDSSVANLQVGHFDPRGDVFFSEKDKFIVRARLTGNGKLERTSKDHLLFQTRMTRQPEITIDYTCVVGETSKGK